MSEPGIQQFWLGQSVVFGCLDCHEAAHTREGIDHADDCSVHSDDGLRADGGLRTPTHCPHCGYDGAVDGHGPFTRSYHSARFEGGVVETSEKWDTFHCPECGERFALLDKTVRQEFDEDGNRVQEKPELVTDGGEPQETDSEQFEVVISSDGGLEEEHARAMRRELVRDGFNEDAVSVRSTTADDGFVGDGTNLPRVCVECGTRWLIGSQCILCGGEVVADD